MTIFNEPPSSSKFEEHSEQVAAISPPTIEQSRLNEQSEAQLDQQHV